jgi:hypothetical protein
MTRPENIQAIREALVPREHYLCDDSYYSCPKSEDGGINRDHGSECICGADEHNSRVIKALAALDELAAQAPKPAEMLWRCVKCGEVTTRAGSGQEEPVDIFKELFLAFKKGKTLVIGNFRDDYKIPDSAFFVEEEAARTAVRALLAARYGFETTEAQGEEEL